MCRGGRLALGIFGDGLQSFLGLLFWKHSKGTIQVQGYVHEGLGWSAITAGFLQGSEALNVFMYLFSCEPSRMYSFSLSCAETEQSQLMS